MLFSSITFIYYFLPVVFAAYFLLPKKCRNIVLLLSSLLFYFYGESQYILLLFVSTLIDYTAGRLIDKYRGTPKAKLALLFSILANLGMLGFFKYADFIISTINAVSGANIPLLHIPLPLGISFFTFQTMSYSIDVYRGDAPVQKNVLSFGTYVTLFPQLVAGPIVRYQTVAGEIDQRSTSWQDFAEGTGRFIIGLGKKVLIANVLGEFGAVALAPANPSVVFYWMAIVTFALQVYFDFSGYSDMAIGLGRMFGFHFLENFDYPFISKSASEFWRRWHISMGTWFREYIYIPLGGNRGGRLKWMRNVFIVWFCTGLWHGASWNFVVWGLYFGVVLTLEKLVWGRALAKTPGFVQHIYTLLVVLLSFVIFHVEDAAQIITHFRGMFGLTGAPLVTVETGYYVKSYAVVLLAACVGATPLAKSVALRCRQSKGGAKVLSVLEPVFYIAVLLIVTGYLVDSSFNPFLYFRF